MKEIERQKRTDEVINFISETDKIIITLLRCKHSGNTSTKRVITEWNKYVELFKACTTNGTFSIEIIRKHNTAVLEVFKLFEDSVPQIKKIISRVIN